MKKELKDNIILIEDRDEDIQLIKRIITQTYPNLNLIVINDSEVALEHIKNKKILKHRPKLIILDINMPKINGLELLLEIKINNDYNKIPSIIFSSSTHQNDINNAYSNNINSYVQKPMNYKDLKKVLTATIDYWTNINLS
ncbi:MULTISPECIES: response regulator [Mesoflavibacter]|uniref:Response regulator n=1 Tax=Mesoflavibacter profundi TaxID=2708110 RepID=A0ABT4RXL9_9FLAO|nr:MULTISPECIES: response regulator [Mesoflavibacter]MDA0176522.1 response regulator [Mesoflavibacter profundi]QIJ90160.1 hypothetical protein C7H62_2352 [Mesoflavibacter sp. HG96]QIJ92888.1 hypothetical protein C7H56_2352 [Mesoflavibacter sp. HG37]